MLNFTMGLLKFGDVNNLVYLSKANLVCTHVWILFKTLTFHY